MNSKTDRVIPLSYTVLSNVVFSIYSKAENEHFEKMKVVRSSCVKPPSEKRQSLYCLNPPPKKKHTNFLSFIWTLVKNRQLTTLLLTQVEYLLSNVFWGFFNPRRATQWGCWKYVTIDLWLEEIQIVVVNEAFSQ